MWSACVALLLLLLRLPLESFLDVLQKTIFFFQNKAHTFRNFDTDTIKVVSAWACGSHPRGDRKSVVSAGWGERVWNPGCHFGSRSGQSSAQPVINSAYT